MAHSATVFGIEYLLVTTVYTILFITAVYGGLLYYRAFHQMKKTRMILAMFTVLAGIAIDTLYWLAVTVENVYHPHIAHHLLNPYFTTIPKFLLLCAVGYFVYASLTPTEAPNLGRKVESAKQCAEECRR